MGISLVMLNLTRPSGWHAQACVTYTTIPTLGMLGNEATELESVLAKLRMPQRIVVLHYSPKDVSHTPFRLIEIPGMPP